MDWWQRLMHKSFGWRYVAIHPSHHDIGIGRIVCRLRTTDRGIEYFHDVAGCLYLLCDIHPTRYDVLTK